MGAGVVGGGVAQSLLDRESPVSRRAGCPIRLLKVLVRDLSKERPVPRELLTTNPRDIIDDPSIQVVVEVIGGECPARDYIYEALSSGKHVVTANKEVLAKHGPELRAAASAARVNLLFEASVGGGIPIVGPLTGDLLANETHSIHAIINGTTNYILTRMAKQGLDFASALREAQERGYAESDPSKDIEGVDAAYKLAVLATLAFGTRVHADDVYTEGISSLQPQDFRYAEELGFAIKLLAIARRRDEVVEARVHPCLLPKDDILAKVEGVYNAIEVEGHLVGRVLFHGRGAGREPTTSAVIGDLLEVARRMTSGGGPLPAPALDEHRRVSPISDLASKYYLRLNVADEAGVLAQISSILGEPGISIASVIQKDTDPVAQTAEIVVTTHPAREQAMQHSLRQIEGLDVVVGPNQLIRIEDRPKE